MAALGLVATACGSGSDPSEGASRDQAARSADEDGRELPGTFPLGLTGEEYVARIEESQALIAKCMAEAGFEYVAASVQGVALAEHADRVQPGYTREEYKKYWGYGVSTRFDNLAKEIELGAQNFRYIETLSEADKVAYERTLYGDDPNSTFAFALGDEDFSSTGGCTRKAVEQVFTPKEIRGDFVNPKDVLIEKDRRVAKANADWVACMEGYGYVGYLDQDEIIEDFEQRFEALTDDEEAPTLTGPELAKLKQMQSEEIAASLADLECESKHVRPVVRKVEEEVYGFRVSGRRDVDIPRSACPSCGRVPPAGGSAQGS
ncbi:MAG: hypothetical protein ACRDPC_02355 [Solirubrobacteraceae bacterium]